MNCFGKKLNIGCYYMKLDGFINIDINPDCEPDILGDIRELEFENESVDLILASQVLEHFDLMDVKFLLSKFYRWLKKCGQLIIEVPDVGKILDMVEKGEWKIENYMGAIYGNREIIGQAHKSQFDEILLTNMLKEAGFKNINRNFNTSDNDEITLRYDCIKE
jgi:predicted SAM-dependent methyltransferase